MLCVLHEPSVPVLVFRKWRVLLCVQQQVRAFHYVAVLLHLLFVRRLVCHALCMQKETLSSHLDGSYALANFSA